MHVKSQNTDVNFLGGKDIQVFLETALKNQQVYLQYLLNSDLQRKKDIYKIKQKNNPPCFDFKRMPPSHFHYICRLKRA